MIPNKKITELVLRRFKNSVILESRRSDKVRQTRNVIKHFTCPNDDSMETAIDVETEEMLFRDWVFGRLDQTPLINFEPLLAKLYYKDLNQRKSEIGLLKAFIHILHSNMASTGAKISPPKLDWSDIDGWMTFDDFWNTYGHYYSEDAEDASRLQHNNEKGYEKVVIDYFQEAEYYGIWSGDGKSGELCFTMDKDIWDRFTDEGSNTCYLFLKKGWKEMRAVKGKNCPYDEYGLSMIWAFVTPNGILSNSNLRWNHINENGRTDHNFTVKELCETVGFSPKELGLAY